MKLNKAHKFTLIVLIGTIAFLYGISQTQVVAVDWNSMFNGTLQTIVGGFITMTLTIVVYRYLYHRKSKT